MWKPIVGNFGFRILMTLYKLGCSVFYYILFNTVYIWVINLAEMFSKQNRK